MVIYSNKPIEECIDILKQNIVIKKRSFSIYTPNIIYNNEIVGDVKKTEFWIEKIKARYVYTISRAFEGKFHQDEGKVKIAGKFKFPKQYFILGFGFVGIVTFLICKSNIQHIIAGGEFSFQMLYGLAGPLLLLISLVGLSYLSIFIHRRDEQYIIDFLKQKLCN